MDANIVNTGKNAKSLLKMKMGKCIMTWLWTNSNRLLAWIWDWMQVICQRNFNVILTRKEGETLTEQEIRDIGIRCALRHMDSLRMQAKEEKKADFTEPCKNCPDIESCNCDCSTTTKKIADEAGYNTDLVAVSYTHLTLPTTSRV